MENKLKDMKKLNKFMATLRAKKDIKKQLKPPQIFRHNFIKQIRVKYKFNFFINLYYIFYKNI